MPSINRPPAASDQPGLKKLGRYECTEQVGGDGGFETYRARVRGLTGLDRSFAVKVLRLNRSEMASAISEPFLHAAKRCAALANPRIATVVEAEVGEGLVFAATPFMEGLDLGRFLRAARDAGLLATSKDDKAHHWYSIVAYIGAEIARGLQTAHSQEPPLVHGALCPGNVFLTSRGAIRLLDFGLRAAVRRPFEPRPRRLLPYIAPELAAPASDGTMAGDMYSLGVLLCELGSGELPPQGRRASEMQIALSLLPDDLGLLIGRLVSVSPAARPPANDAVASLAAAHRDMTQPDLVAALASLVQRFASERAKPQESSEAVVSLSGSSDGANESVDEAPPPPSDVEHDDAYGIEGSQVTRMPEPPRVAAVQAADFSRPSPGTRDDLFASPEPTTVGEPALMEDLVARSRPSTAGAGFGENRANPPRIRTSPAGSPTPVPSAVASIATSGEPGRGSTLHGFGPTGTATMDAPPEKSTGISGEWAERPPSRARPGATPSSAPAVSSFGAPAQAPFPGDAEPAVLPPRESAQDLMLPSVDAIDAPSTWGARALAALGGQAGIDSSSGGSSGGLGLLDEVRLAPAESIPLAGSPTLNPADGLGGRLRSPQALALDGPPIARHRVLAEPFPPGLGSGLGLQASGDEAMAADFQARAEAAQPRNDALLEDHLVDAPDGIRLAPSWSQAPPSAGYGLVAEAAADQPPPESDPYAQEPSPAVAEAVALADDGMPSSREDGTFLDDGGQPAAAPAYFDDSGQPLPESEIAALPEAPAAPAPAWVPPTSLRSSGGGWRSTAARPPGSQQGSVPAWVNSPDARSGKHEHRRLIWGIVGSVLGTSIVVGGLAGFFVGSRGKPWSAMLGIGRPSALSKPQPAGLQSPSEDDATPAGLAPSASATPAKTPAAGSAGLAPAVAKAAPAARTSGPEKAPAASTAEGARGLPARAPAAVASPPSTQELALPGPARKNVTGAEAGVPGAWGKGVSDSGGGLVGVSVSSQPTGATVWINGKERGRTPLQVKIQTGPAHVVMVLAGHASATTDVTASEGMEVSKELSVIDPPMTGEARFRAECTTSGKLPIVVDGKETGVLCPFSKLRVDPGVHRIGLFVPALGKVHEKEVTLHPGVRSIVFAD